MSGLLLERPPPAVHFSLLVLIPPGASDFRAEVGRLLAPYEKFEVPPYKDRDDVSELTEEMRADALASGDLGRDEEGYFWWYSVNPKGYWDYYLLGGRWDGAVIGAPPPKHEVDDGTLERNMAPVPEVPEDFVAGAVVTPDGQWYDSLEFDDFHATSPAWHSRVRKLLDTHSDCMAVVVDAHA